MITIQNASIGYHGKRLFENLNFHLEEGKWTALLGQSGIGKSSLLRLIAGLLTPQDIIQGKVSFKKELNPQHEVAYMAQTDLLLPWLSIRDNLLISLKLKKHPSALKRLLVKKADLLLKRAGIEKAAHLYPNQLSGGMRQRAALVRTLLLDKPVILMDEPFSALDAITRYNLQALAAELLHDKTVLFITHDPMEALRLGHHIYIMQGEPAQIRLIAALSSPLPRELSNQEMSRWYELILKQLA